MSTLEKFGILVILILVVVIGVVAVWGVGGDAATDPFGARDVATGPSADPGSQIPDWSTPPRPAGTNPAASPVPPPAVAATRTPPNPDPVPVPASKTYTVKKGETLSGISEAMGLGKSNWQRIVDANPGLDPRRLKVGQVIAIPDLTGTLTAGEAPSRPPVTGLRAGNPDDGPTGGAPEKGSVEAPKGTAEKAGKTDEKTTEYVVQDGDTLIGISKALLKDGNKYHEIERLNPGLDPRKLRRGMRIRVPVAE